MPDDCLTKRCFDCESHAIVSGKLDCNYMNRLGLAQPTVKTFMDDLPKEKTEEDLNAELAQMEEQQKAIEEKRKELLKLKEMGGKENASMS